MQYEVFKHLISLNNRIIVFTTVLSLSCVVQRSIRELYVALSEKKMGQYEESAKFYEGLVQIYSCSKRQ